MEEISESTSTPFFTSYSSYTKHREVQSWIFDKEQVALGVRRTFQLGFDGFPTPEAAKRPQASAFRAGSRYCLHKCQVTGASDLIS